MARFVLDGARTLYRKWRAPSLLRQHTKLHLGCGARNLPGWANVDINGLGDIVWDLRKALPVKDVRFVYAEHFIEHVTRKDAAILLSTLRERLAPGGVIRISTPDLTRLVSDYQSGHLVQMPHGSWFPATLCQMVNEGMRNWGHQYVYDEPELRMLLAECGFTKIERVRSGESHYPELANIESRPDFEDLVLECQ